MKKHLKFNKKHNNIIKSKIFLKILPFLIAGATLGSCQKDDDIKYFLEITEWTTTDEPSGSSDGGRPSGGNASSQFTKGKTIYQDCLGKIDWDTDKEYYDELNKYRDGKEAATREYRGGGVKMEVDLYIYKNAKSQQLADSLKQKTK